MHRPTRPLTIGILGGIACGKSLVSRFFAQLGAEIVNADALAQAQLDTPATQAAIAKAFGRHVLGDEGVDRAALAAIVFRDPEARILLEALVHPPVLAAIEARLAAGPDDPHGHRRVVVLDVPLLLETAFGASTDLLVFVDCSLKVRATRARQRGWADGELERREKHQLALEKKRAAAHVTLDNNSSIEALERAVKTLWETHVAPALA